MNSRHHLEAINLTLLSPQNLPQVTVLGIGIVLLHLKLRDSNLPSNE